MKTQVKQLIENAIAQLKNDNVLPADCEGEVIIDRTRDKNHGDFACNIAMRLAKAAKTNPRELANKIINAIEANPFIEKIDIAGPGFINFPLSEDIFHFLNIIKVLVQQKISR